MGRWNSKFQGRTSFEEDVRESELEGWSDLMGPSITCLVAERAVGDLRVEVSVRNGNGTDPRLGTARVRSTVVMPLDTSEATATAGGAFLPPA